MQNRLWGALNISFVWTRTISCGGTREIGGVGLPKTTSINRLNKHNSQQTNNIKTSRNKQQQINVTTNTKNRFCVTKIDVTKRPHANTAQKLQQGLNRTPPKLITRAPHHYLTTHIHNPQPITKTQSKVPQTGARRFCACLFSFLCLQKST